MEAPCQKTVWEVLPAIRPAIAVELVGCGVSRVAATGMPGIVSSVVSQFLSGKRGYCIGPEGHARGPIELPAKDLKDRKTEDLVAGICAICRQPGEASDQTGPGTTGCSS